MIKYRSTAYPELIFIHAYLLHQACLQLLRSVVGAALLTMADAITAVKLARRKRRRRPKSPPDEELLGAPQPLTVQEVLAVLPREDHVVGLRGLPYLLYSDSSLEDRGWPTHADLPDGVGKLWSIMHELGLAAGGEPGDEAVNILLHKYVRAELPVGDTVSCAQCKTQQRKDNSWCYAVYTTPDDEQLTYVGQFQYFIMAKYVTANGWNRAASCRVPAQPLRLAVLNLYDCEEVHTPGLRAADPELGRPPEFLRMVMARSPTGEAVLPFQGQWVVSIDTLQAQLVPTRTEDDAKYFMWANKASGRTGPVKLV